MVNSEKPAGGEFMRVVGTAAVTYILLNGISVMQPVNLGANVELLSADTSHLNFDAAVSTVSEADAIAVVAAFIPRITAQFKISAETPKELAIAAWNSSWDAILLSAIFHEEIGFNLQSDTESTAIGRHSRLQATNYLMHGINTRKPHEITDEEARWLASNFPRAREMLKDESFKTAIHCLASYRWHSMPRIKLAVLWAGIEGLFKANTEIRFRISLYIAKFLHPEGLDSQRISFDSIRKLYDLRSAAVHGGKLKQTAKDAVEESAQLLQKIILQCIIRGAIPVESELVP